MTADYSSETIKRDREILARCDNYFSAERREAERRDRERAIEDIKAGRVDPDGLDGV